MRLSQPRFTVRSLMVAVAIVALGIGTELTRRRWVHCRRIVRFYAVSERHYRDEAKEIAAEIGRGQRDLDLALEQRLWMAERAAQLREKWERSATRPWESLTPDPPPRSAPPPSGEIAGR
jgi:hypothetical protein